LTGRAPVRLKLKSNDDVPRAGPAAAIDGCRPAPIGEPAGMSPTARDVMTPAPEFLKQDTTLLLAAERMAQEETGALPVCDQDDRLIGVVTDRDIVVKAIAKGENPSSVTVGTLTGDQPEVVTIGADDPIEDALRTMADHQVRRLPVIDDNRLVGMVAQADLARALPAEQAGALIQAISAG
jgi:CBS domain-containing protein